MIVVSSLKLAFDTYLDFESTNLDDQFLVSISSSIDTGLNLFFLFEVCIKIVAYGFYFDEETFLKDYWNVLDFFIVSTSLLDMIISDINISFIKVTNIFINKIFFFSFRF